MRKYFKRAASLALAGITALSMAGISPVQVYADGSSITDFLSTEQSDTMYQYADGTEPDNDLNGAGLPDSVDLRAEELVTPVRDQASWGTCWAFATCAALESAALSDGLETSNETSIFSPKFVAWYTYTLRQTDADGQLGEGCAIIPQTSTYNAGGNADIQASKILSDGIGPAYEADFPYQNTEGTVDTTGDWTLPESERFTSEYSLVNENNLPDVWVDGQLDVTALNNIKSELVRGRAVGFSYFVSSDYLSKSETEYGSYFEYAYQEEDYNHAVTIIGYNDNIPKECFTRTVEAEDGTTKTYVPECDGAFLVRNSWGDGWGDNGYFWLSYCDRSTAGFFTFDLEENSDEDINAYDCLADISNIDQYSDTLLMTANAFEGYEDAKTEIREVSYESSHPGMTTQVQIVELNENAADPLDGTLLYSGSFTDTYGGYHKKTLDREVLVGQGKNYSVVLTQTLNGEYYRSFTVMPEAETVPDANDPTINMIYYRYSVVNEGESLFYENGEWADLRDLYSVELSENIMVDNFSIKTYTAPVSIGSGRLAGNTRYGTALAVANQLLAENGGKFSSIVLATGENFPDALAGSSFAATVNAPVLLVDGDYSSANTQLVLSTLSSYALDDATIYLLGGESAIDVDTENALAASYKTKRLSGANRYETDLAIIGEMNVLSGCSVCVVRGDDFADSIAVSGAAGYYGMPIVLADKSGLTDAQMKELNKIHPDTVYIIGGEAAVSTEVELQLNSLGTTVERLQGATRYETSLAIAERFGAGINYESAVLATGSAFPDGLTGGVLAAKLGAPVILVSNNAASADNDAVKAFLNSFSISSVYAVGGSSAVPDEVVEALCG